eukprot:scaffold5892_cov112-Isochrysis_galbana.AAC.1
MAAARSWGMHALSAPWWLRVSVRPQQSVCRWCRCCPATARPGIVPFGVPLAARLRAAALVTVARPESRPSGPTPRRPRDVSDRARRRFVSSRFIRFMYNLRFDKLSAVRQGAQCQGLCGLWALGQGLGLLSPTSTTIVLLLLHSTLYLLSAHLHSHTLYCTYYYALRHMPTAHGAQHTNSSVHMYARTPCAVQQSHH